MISRVIKCPVCNFEYDFSETTKHHLVPKSRKGREIVRICHTCHHQIHNIFTNKELDNKYDTIEKILETEEMKKWVTWVNSKKTMPNIRNKISSRKRRVY